MANINWFLSVQVEGGPKITFANPRRVVEAYDKIDVIVPTDASSTNPQIVEIQPSAAAQVKFLLIKADVEAGETGLTYKVSNGVSSDSTTPTRDETGDIVLNEPHLYSEGMIKALLPDSPLVLEFTNVTEGKVAVEILVGRDATPEPESTESTP